MEIKLVSAPAPFKGPGFRLRVRHPNEKEYEVVMRYKKYTRTPFQDCIVRTKKENKNSLFGKLFIHTALQITPDEYHSH